MSIGKRFRYPAALVACGVLSFVAVFASRWPTQVPDARTPEPDPPVAARGPVTPYSPVIGLQPPAKGMPQPAPRAVMMPLPEAGPAALDPRDIDVTQEQTEAMWPAPPGLDSYGDPTESPELVEGEPVAQLR